MKFSLGRTKKTDDAAVNENDVVTEESAAPKKAPDDQANDKGAKGEKASAKDKPAKEKKPKEKKEKKDKAQLAAEKAEKKAEKAAAKKSKSGGSTNPADLVKLHGEKVGLAVIVIVFGYLGYAGLSFKGLDKVKSPESLQSKTSQVRTAKATEDATTGLLDDRQAAMGLQERVQDGLNSTDSTNYATTQPWSPLPPPRLGKRTDPNLLKPIKMQVRGDFVAIAEQARGSEDLIASLPAADPKKATVTVESKPRTEPKRQTRPARPRGGGSGGDTYMPYDPASVQMGNEAADAASESYSPYGAGGDILSSPMGGPGMMGMMGGSTGVRLLLAKYRVGFIKVGMSTAMSSATSGTGASPMDMMAMQPNYDAPGAESTGGTGSVIPGMGQDAAVNFPGAVPKTRPFTTVMALFPFEQQASEYEHAFQEAAGYQPQQDVPRIVFMEAQRVDVTDDPTRVPDESEWKPTTDTNDQSTIREKIWAGTAASSLDPQFFDLNCTTDVPPALMAKIEPIDLHAETPKAVRKAPVVADSGQDGDETADEGRILDQFDRAPGTSGPGPRRPGPARPGAGGSMMPGAGGAGMPYPSAGGASPYSPQMPAGDAGGAAAYAMGGMMMPGMEGGAMTGMPGMSMGQLTPPKYKLVRFYDFRIAPGRVYRYRVRLWLEDPNHPYDPNAAPPLQMLDDAVVARVRQVEIEDAKVGKNERTYWRMTDWSDASEPVSVEVPEDVFVGGAIRPNAGTIEISGRPGEPLEIARNPMDEVEGELSAVIWGGRYSKHAANAASDAYPTMIPGTRKVRRGTVMNFATDAEVVHPMSYEIKKIEGYQFATNSVVVDIRGGDTLPGGEKDKPHLAPAEFALIDDEGNFIVRNEIDTIEGFRRYTFADETERANAAAGPSMMPAGPGAAPGGMLPGMEGMMPDGGDAMFPGMTPGMTPPGTGRPPRRGRGGQ